MTVFLTRRAEKNYGAIKAQIRSKWGEKTAEEFVLKTDEFFNLLKAHPAMGQVEKDEIRGFQLTPQTRVLYRTKGEKIIVLALFDVRQNPNKRFT